MPSTFCKAELCRRFERALELADPDCVELTVKACVAARMPIRELFQAADATLSQAPRSVVRRSFRAIARLDQLDEFGVLLHHASADIRLAVIHVFYNFGGQTDAHLLDPLRSDADAAVRARALAAIEQLHQHASRRTGTLPDTAAELSDSEHVLAHLLLGTAASQDRGHIARLLFARSGVVRQIATEFLAPPDPVTRDVLLTVIAGEVYSGAPLTKEAADALKDIGNRRAAQILLHAVSSPDSRVYGIPALQVLGPVAGEVLLDAFHADPAGFPHGKLLAQTAGTVALDPLLRSFASQYRAARESAVEGLVALDPATISQVLSSAPSVTESTADLLTLLGRLAPVEAFDTIAQHAESGNPAVRTVAIRALSKFHTRRGVQALIMWALRSPHRHVREAAAATS